MTAQLQNAEGNGPIWFFTSSETDLARALRESSNGVAHFVSKGHDLFATLHGKLIVGNDRAMVDQRWNRFVAAWFEGGRNNPKAPAAQLRPRVHADMVQ